MEKKFYLVGINYEKADVEKRGKYTFFPDYVREFIKDSKSCGLENFFIVSTCNRTEFYGFADNSDQIINQYCNFVQGGVEDFKKIMVVKESESAINHLFRVSSGLESQILGDFDIIGQIKIWFTRFRNGGSTNAFLERLVSTAIQISKRVKNETLLSNGSASLAYSVINFIQKTESDLKNKNILLYGTGKIGRITCINLVKHCQNITVINRTRKKAEIIANNYNIIVKDHSELKNELKKADILIVATGSSNYTVTDDMISHDKKMTIIDMSIPENVSHKLTNRKNILSVNVDTLSSIVDDTMFKRRSAIPDALKIIEDYKSEFYQWLETRELVPVIHSFKDRLNFFQSFALKSLKKENISVDENETLLTEKVIQKITNQFASYLIENKDNAHETIELINKMFHLKHA